MALVAATPPPTLGIHATHSGRESLFRPHLRRDFLDGPLHEFRIVQFLPQPQTPLTKLAMISCRVACGPTSGWNCRPKNFRRAIFRWRRYSELFGDGDRFEIARQFRELSPCEFQTCNISGRLRNNAHDASFTVSRPLPYSRSGLSRPCRRRNCANNCTAVADAGAQARRVRKYSGPATGNFLAYTLDGPPDKMMPTGCQRGDFHRRSVVARMTEYTLHSRMRRGITWVYCDPNPK